ncbi:hypothetical protein COLO4_16186 [Corchorus olitorius]|nr:hypothetical protein COLO4_16186 [Corchorus olitorius]
MYLLVHYICSCSDIFGFETKLFFALFLSRDEAFKLIPVHFHLLSLYQWCQHQQTTGIVSVILSIK